MSFLPDLASWALGGGAGNPDNAGDGNGGEDGQQRQGNSLGAGGSGGGTGAGGGSGLTDDEIRRKRVARMMAMQQQQQQQNQRQEDEEETEQETEMDKMEVEPTTSTPTVADVDMADASTPATATAAATTPTGTVNNNSSSGSGSTAIPSSSESDRMDVVVDNAAVVVDSDEPRTKKTKASASSPAKASAAAPSAADMARKLAKKKDLLLRKTLSIALAGTTSTGSGTDQSCVVIDLGGSGSNDGASSSSAAAASSPEITVQSITEILAARLSLPRTHPSLRTAITSTQQNSGTGIVAYCGQCYVRASQEIKTVREGRERRDKRRRLKEEKAKGAEEAVEAATATGTTDSILNTHDEELIAILKEIQIQVVNYTASSLLEPDLFDLGTDGPSQLAAALLQSSVDPTNGITMNVAGSGTSFYSKLCDELMDVDEVGFGRVVGEAVMILSDALAKCDTVADGGGGGGDTGGGGDASPLVLVNALTALCGNKAAAAVVATHPTFLLPPAGSAAASERITPPQPVVPPDANQQQAQLYRMMAALTRGHRRGYDRRSGPALERDTIVGRVMKVGCPRDDPDFLTAFANMGSRSKKDSDNTTNGLRSQLTAYQVAVNGLVKTLITAGAGPRGKMMDWFRDALLVNSGAAAMRPDRSKVSDQATLINVTVALLKLCEPFLANDKKAGLIDPDFVSSPSDHGGLYATEGDDAIPRLAENPPSPAQPYAPKNSFIPLCFFLAARSIHLSVIPALDLHESLLRWSSRAYHDAQARGDNGRTDPDFNRYLARVLAHEVTIFSPGLLSDSLRFSNAMSGLLLRITDDELARMPEHFIDDLCDCVTMMSHSKPEAMRGVDVANVFKVVVKLLSPSYAKLVRNYNLRAKLGDVLHDLYLPPKTNHRDAVPSSVYCDPTAGGQPYLLSDKLAQETLAPSLLLLYGEVEHTGYYEKMNHRAKISELLRFLWESSEHRSAFRKISQNKESFIKFSNGLMNETNHQIAEAMEKLVEIRRVQVQMGNPQEWASVPEEQRETISSRHEANEREVKSTLLGLNKTLEMLGWLNADPDIRRLFLLDEMVSRLVNMLFHVLMKLVGAKGLELKVWREENFFALN